ncbi:MAG: VOC family protein [Planctomycetes bacterium]|nr:VOC family protein [Planctomycetota bacterium]
MLSIGDIHVYVSDFAVALRFWCDGIGLTLVEHEPSAACPYALLEFPDGGPGLRLFGGVKPWSEKERPPVGTRPTIRFDVATSDFDGILAAVLEFGGQQVDEIEEYSGMRVVTLADPDGNTFEVVEVPEE